MRTAAENLFYTLGAIILGAGIFVLQPVTNPETAKFQQDVRSQFSTAAVQVFGDQPVFDDAELLVSSINEFYIQSADAMIAILKPAVSERDMAFVARGVYDQIVMLINPNSNLPHVAGAQTENLEFTANFMQEEPVYNIVPVTTTAPYQNNNTPTAPPTPYVQSAFSSTIVSAAASFAPAVNDGADPWVNIRDNTTGQVYCVAIFNSEVNRYLGACGHDYH